MLLFFLCCMLLVQFMEVELIIYLLGMICGTSLDHHLRACLRLIRVRVGDGFVVGLCCVMGPFCLL